MLLFRQRRGVTKNKVAVVDSLQSILQTRICAETPETLDSPVFVHLSWDRDSEIQLSPGWRKREKKKKKKVKPFATVLRRERRATGEGDYAFKLFSAALKEAIIADVDRSRKASERREGAEGGSLFEQLYFHESLCTRANVSTNEPSRAYSREPLAERRNPGSIERRFKESK